MFATDEDDTNNIKPTDFDKQRIKDMEIGAVVEGELGNWKVMKYKKEYTVLFYNNPKYQMMDFKSYSDLIMFLENH